MAHERFTAYAEWAFKEIARRAPEIAARRQEELTERLKWILQKDEKSAGQIGGADWGARLVRRTRRQGPVDMRAVRQPYPQGTEAHLGYAALVAEMHSPRGRRHFETGGSESTGGRAQVSGVACRRC